MLQTNISFTEAEPHNPEKLVEREKIHPGVER
jgi:hypothetical protein